jgi:hypothetical protein
MLLAAMYREAAADEQGRFDEVTPYTGALEALGFTRLCRVTVGSGKAISQVWVSREGDAFAEPEWMPGPAPHLSFRSVLPDGTILQTSTPRVGKVRLIPFWTRQHHPKAGYLLEERAGMPHELWARHRERVAEAARSRGGASALDASLAVFLDLANRTVKLARARARLAQWVGLALFLAVAIPLSVKQHAGWALALTALVWAVATWGTFALSLRLGWPRLEPPRPGTASSSRR